MTPRQRITFERYLRHNLAARSELEAARRCLLELLDGESSDPEARRALLDSLGIVWKVQN